EARHYESEGELFQAYDLARKGLQVFPTDAALKHRVVLYLASVGATARATKEFTRLGLDHLTEVPSAAVSPGLALDIAALAARLLKDDAVATTGGERVSKLVAAAEAYEAVYREADRTVNPEAYYPGIICATLLLL